MEARAIHVSVPNGQIYTILIFIIIIVTWLPS